MVEQTVSKPIIKHGLYNGNKATHRNKDRHEIVLPEKFSRLLKRKWKQYSEEDQYIKNMPKGYRVPYHFNGVVNFTYCVYENYHVIAILCPRDLYTKKRGREIATGRMKKVIDMPNFENKKDIPYWLCIGDDNGGR